MFFYFKIYSKDDQVLKKFLTFLLKLNLSPIFLKSLANQKKRKFLTILKSPHVNKTAQEQFEFRYYSKRFMIDSIKPLTFSLIIKKIKNLSFPGLKLEIKVLLNFEKKNKTVLNQTNPNNVVLYCKTSKKLGIQKKYIQLFDSYGELWLKSLSVNQKVSNL